MIQKTCLFRSSLLAALWCGLSAASLLAQGPGGPPPGGHRHGPPPNALFDALDTNHDGVISADEMSNAPTSLKAMLKNGATEIRREDLRPAHPGGGPAADPQSQTEAREARSAPSATTADQMTDSANPRADAPSGGPGRGSHHGPPPNALFDALDTNRDGVISADEMNNAPASLKTLMKNGAAGIKREDLRPPRPPQPQ